MRAPTIFIAAFLLMPAAAGAAKVAIVPVEYVQIQSGEVRDAARQVEDKVADGAREAGFEVVRGAAVADAVKQQPACAAAARDRGCLEAVAEALGVDEAIAVSVTDDDHTSYRVELSHARRDKVVDERTAGFFVVLEWVRGTVALALQKPASQGTGTNAPPAPPPPPLPDSPKPSKAAVPDAAAARSKPIPRPVFWTGVAVTGALAVAWGATDIATYHRYKELKGEARGERSQGDWDAAHRLQVADRALLGVGLAAAAATAVMYFFTDFETAVASSSAPLAPPEIGGMAGPNTAGGITAVAPVALPSGGGLALEGRV
jgi:hypothetical protein